MTIIRKSLFKNVYSTVLENELLEINVLPLGGRINSIIKKDGKRQYLVQQPGKDYTKGIYGGKYTDYGSSGFDDIFGCRDVSLHR